MKELTTSIELVTSRGKFLTASASIHGLCTTHKDQVNEDLLAFIKG